MGGYGSSQPRQQQLLPSQDQPPTTHLPLTNQNSSLPPTLPATSPLTSHTTLKTRRVARHTIHTHTAPRPPHKHSSVKGMFIAKRSLVACQNVGRYTTELPPRTTNRRFPQINLNRPAGWEPGLTHHPETHIASPCPHSKLVGMARSITRRSGHC